MEEKILKITGKILELASNIPQRYRRSEKFNWKDWQVGGAWATAFFPIMKNIDRREWKIRVVNAFIGDKKHPCDEKVFSFDDVFFYTVVLNTGDTLGKFVSCFFQPYDRHKNEWISTPFPLSPDIFRHRYNNFLFRRLVWQLKFAEWTAEYVDGVKNSLLEFITSDTGAARNISYDKQTGNILITNKIGDIENFLYQPGYKGGGVQNSATIWRGEVFSMSEQKITLDEFVKIFILWCESYGVETASTAMVSYFEAEEIEFQEVNILDCSIQKSFEICNGIRLHPVSEIFEQLSIPKEFRKECIMDKTALTIDYVIRRGFQKKPDEILPKCPTGLCKKTLLHILSAILKTPIFVNTCWRQVSNGVFLSAGDCSPIVHWHHSKNNQIIIQDAAISRGNKKSWHMRYHPLVIKSMNSKNKFFLSNENLSEFQVLVSAYLKGEKEFQVWMTSILNKIFNGMSEMDPEQMGRDVIVAFAVMQTLFETNLSTPQTKKYPFAADRINKFYLYAEKMEINDCRQIGEYLYSEYRNKFGHTCEDLSEARVDMGKVEKLFEMICEVTVKILESSDFPK